MLEKIPGRPLLHKVRVIHLFEADQKNLSLGSHQYTRHATDAEKGRQDTVSQGPHRTLVVKRIMDCFVTTPPFGRIHSGN
jgi:hypothetical protein